MWGIMFMKFLKVSLISLLALVIILYLTLLFVIPNVVNLDKYKPDIQKIAKEQANLNIDFDNAKITVTPLLSAGIKADKLSIKFWDNSDLFSIDSLIGRISIPQLFLKKINVTKAEIISPKVNIDIIDGREYKI